MEMDCYRSKVHTLITKFRRDYGPDVFTSRAKAKEGESWGLDILTSQRTTPMLLNTPIKGNREMWS